MATTNKDQAPEGVTTMGTLAADSPADNTVAVDAAVPDAEKTVTLTGPGGVKVTTSASAADGLKAVGFTAAK